MVVWTALAGCRPTPSPPSVTSQASSDISIALDQSVYYTGDLAYVTITNPTDSVVLFALFCDAFIEGRDREEWQTVLEPDCSNVRVRPTRLDRGGRVVLEFRLEPLALEALPVYETFRMRLRFQREDNAGYRTVYSSDFELKSR